MNVDERERDGLFFRRFGPDGDARGTICLVHGICEHSGRYAAFARHMCDAGYAVSTFDLPGHGRSAGERGQARVAPTLRALDGLVAAERTKSPRVFVYGHSLGGLLTLAYLVEHRPQLAGAVTSGAALHTSVTRNKTKVLAAHLLGRVLPTRTMPVGLDRSQLMRDPAVLADYNADPLVHDRTSLGLARDFLLAVKRVLRDADKIDVPLLLIHGAADKVNFPSGSRAIADKLGARATLREYEGVLHQPHSDPETPRILDDVVRWLSSS